MADTVPDYLPFCDGFIVGTWFKRDGKAENPVDVSRVRDLVAKIKD